MQLYDRAQLGVINNTRDGYVTVEARAARPGIHVYSGEEMGRPGVESIRVYRSPDDLFHKDALASFAYAPVTNDHPPEMVKPWNWRQFAVGFTGAEVARDGDFVRIPLILKDQAAIDSLRAGKFAVSMGYDSDVEFTPGKTSAGEAYDAIQKNYRANHLALVDVARGGPGCKVITSDHRTGGIQMPEPTLRTVSVDGLSITTTDQGAQVIEKLQRQLADSQKALTDTQAAHQVVIAAKDTELGKKDVEIKDLKDKQLDPAKLDQMAAERADVIGKVKAVFPTLNCDGKSLPDIRRLVAAQQFGDANVKDKSDDYVRALFDGITADTKPVDHSTDSFRAGFTGGGGTRTGANDGKTAYGDMVKNLTTRWQTPNGSDKSAGR